MHGVDRAADANGTNGSDGAPSGGSSMATARLAPHARRAACHSPGSAARALAAALDCAAMPYAPLDLTGRTAVVIGGTSGIGRASRARAGRGRRRRRRHLAPRRIVVDETAAEIEATRPPLAARAVRRHRSRPRCETLLRRNRGGLRQGRHHGELRRAHQARADARSRPRTTGTRSSRPTSPARCAPRRSSAGTWWSARYGRIINIASLSLVRRPVRGGGVRARARRRWPR